MTAYFLPAMVEAVVTQDATGAYYSLVPPTWKGDTVLVKVNKGRQSAGETVVGNGGDEYGRINYDENMMHVIKSLAEIINGGTDYRVMITNQRMTEGWYL